ncbi:MAG: rod shape-determining protein MreD [Stellaceae bacterium]
MKLVLLQRDVGLINRLVPTLTAVTCVIASEVPAHLPSFITVTPAFALMAIYYWTLHRPDLLPIAAVFAVGLLGDLLEGAPLGVSPLVLLLVYALVLTQREHLLMRGFTVVWVGFLVVAAAAAVLQWGVVSLFYGMLIDVRAFLFQGVFTVAVYPAVSYLLTHVQRMLLVRA